MSGHPHKGKRSKWRSLFNDFPSFCGEYEWRCKKGRFSGVRVIGVAPFMARLNGEILVPCEQCQWRGLAEKPK